MGEDVLEFTTIGTISAEPFNALTGALTLSGSAGKLTEYRNALQHGELPQSSATTRRHGDADDQLQGQRRLRPRQRASRAT